MDKQRLAEKVVQKMMADDEFSRWMGIEIIDVQPGSVVLEMTVREEMTNGFKVSHGGIAFSLADSALAFASNSYGIVSLALENNISFTRKVSAGDRLRAASEELHSGRQVGVYRIQVTNQEDETVAVFRGTVYRTGQKHFPNH